MVNGTFIEVQEDGKFLFYSRLAFWFKLSWYVHKIVKTSAGVEETLIGTPGNDDFFRMTTFPSQRDSRHILFSYLAETCVLKKGDLIGVKGLFPYRDGPFILAQDMYANTFGGFKVAEV
ncbi:MAG: hypothetical protein AB2531_12885 [Candidatus Thiodiazotropha sp.]